MNQIAQKLVATTLEVNKQLSGNPGTMEAAVQIAIASEFETLIPAVFAAFTSPEAREAMKTCFRDMYTMGSELEQELAPPTATPCE